MAVTEITADTPSRTISSSECADAVPDGAGRRVRWQPTLPRRPPARGLLSTSVLRGLGLNGRREPPAGEPLVDHVPLLQLRHAGRRHARHVDSDWAPCVRRDDPCGLQGLPRPARSDGVVPLCDGQRPRLRRRRHQPATTSRAAERWRTANKRPPAVYGALGFDRPTRRLLVRTSASRSGRRAFQPLLRKPKTSREITLAAGFASSGAEDSHLPALCSAKKDAFTQRREATVIQTGSSRQLETMLTDLTSSRIAIRRTARTTPTEPIRRA
jgi:hypothetical protein